MPQFRAQAGTQYVRRGTNNPLSFTSQQLLDPAQGWLSEDFEIYNPQSSQPSNQSGNTMSSIYGNLLNETPEQKAYRLAQDKYGEEARLRGEGIVDENEIRRRVTDRFQAEIDALNRIYAEKKKRAMFEGEGRLGNDAAIQARRGLIGSTFGGAQTEKVNQFNNEIIGGIDAELQAHLSQIYSAIKSNVAGELAAKTEAKRAGAAEYLEFLKGAAERKQQRISETVKNILSSNLNLDDAMFKGIADQLGVSVDILKSQYNEIKAASDLANEEALIKRTKSLADIDKVNADVEKIRAEIGLDSKKFTYLQKQDLIKNALEGDKFSWQQKQDLIKNELDKSKLEFDMSKDARNYQLELQKYLSDFEKRDIVKINGVDYEFDPETKFLYSTKNTNRTKYRATSKG